MAPTERVPFALPATGEEEVQNAARVIRSGWVTQGPEVRAFEEEFAAYVGARYACAVCNCTAALHLALRAVGVGEGDHVITVSHSFIAAANAVRYRGALPVFVDIEPGTYNLDVSRIEPAIGPRTKAILCVHQMGLPCDLESILHIAGRHGLPVIEDAACAVGSEAQCEGRWERIGRPRGHIACFSFHPRKVLTTGDGGMLTTSNADIDAQLRRWRQHSMSVPDAVRATSAKVIFEEYLDLGYNYRLTDIQAAVGRAQLARMEGFARRRRELGDHYLERLSRLGGLGLPVEPAYARTNWQSFCIRLPDRLDQRTVMQQMLEAGVATRRGVMNAHQEKSYPPGTWSCGYAGCGGARCPHLRQSELARERCILLPMFNEMTTPQVDQVVAALEQACR